MNTPEQYDAIVIGAGSVGDPLSRALASAGRKTALIEKDALGGTCANRGCTPTKAYEASARIAHMARMGKQWGVHAEQVRVDLAGVRAGKDGVVKNQRSETEKAIARTPNLTLLRGTAQFCGPKQILLQQNDGTETKLSTENIVLCTGTRPLVPPVAGLDEISFHTSDTIYESDELPARLLVLGGNYIGVEAAQIFQRFGSATTIVEVASQLLPQEDEDVSGAVQEILERDGITVRTGSRADSISRSGSGEIELRLETGEILTGSHLLLATGRTPNTDKLNLSVAGVETDDKGFIAADERLATNIQGIWAGGDVAGSPQFTHIAYDDFRVLRSQLIGDGSRTRAGRTVPYIVYTDPPLGRIGLSENDARKSGRSYRVAQLPMSEVAYAADVGETDGFIKVLIAMETDQIIGVAALGLHAEEVMSTLQVAMMAGMTSATLRETIFAYPTVADSFSRLFETHRQS